MCKLNSIVFVICLIGYCVAGPLGSKHHVRFKSRQHRHALDADAVAAAATVTVEEAEQSTTQRSTAKLSLPSNATSIRADIKDGFSCENRTYGYYADIENDCQIFHVCMPVAYGEGKEHYFRWSFICPEETIFSQDSFTCMHRQDMVIDCAESMMYYDLNRNFGLINSEETSPEETIVKQDEMVVRTTKKPIKNYKPSRRKPVKSALKINKRPTEAATEEVVKKETTRRPALPHKQKIKNEMKDSNVIQIEITKPQASDKIDIVITPPKREEENVEKIEKVEIVTESSPATIEEVKIVTESAPIVEMTEEEKNYLKQSAGGFENVDPTMAAEAEALINDFLQTMMKNEKPTSPEAMTVIEMPDAPAEIVETTNQEKEIEAEKQKILDELKKAEELEQKLQEEKKKHEELPFKSISIDDVIASVKEQIDHVSTEQPAVPSETETEAEQKVIATTEEILPIYHRFAEVQTDSPSQSETESQSTLVEH